MRTYYHSGQLGDIVYSLPTVRAIGPGHYVTSLKKDRHDSIATLLAIQPYITGVSHFPRGKMGDFEHVPANVTHDLNLMRLPEYAPMHTRLLTVQHSLPFSVQISHEPWLAPASDWERGRWDRAIVARSFRYRRPDIDWHAEVARLDATFSDVAFVGLESEWHDFPVKDVPFIPTATALDLARVIYESRQFSGNQSFPLSLAVGYGVSHRIEIDPTSTNCSFPTHEPIP